MISVLQILTDMVVFCDGNKGGSEIDIDSSLENEDDSIGKFFSYILTHL